MTLHPVTNSPLYKLMVMQNMCELDHDDPRSCYSDPTAWDTEKSKSATRKFELRGLDWSSACVSLTPDSYDDYQYNVCEGCVGILSGSPCTFAPVYEGTPSSTEGRFMQPLVPDPGENVPTDYPEAGYSGYSSTFDNTFEICQYRGNSASCKDSNNCINAYSLAAIADPWLEGNDYTNLFGVANSNCPGNRCPYLPKQVPEYGAGNVNIIYDTPDLGPYRPCRVDAVTSKQVPCEDTATYEEPIGPYVYDTYDFAGTYSYSYDSSSSATGVGDYVNLAVGVAPSKYAKMESPQKLVIQIDNLMLQRVTSCAMHAHLLLLSLRLRRTSSPPGALRLDRHRPASSFGGAG